MTWLFCCLLAAFPISKTHYPLSTEPIDVIIPCAPKDASTLPYCISAIRDYGENIRRIIVVSKERLAKDAEWIDETIYPFTKHEIALEIFHGRLKEATQFLTHRHTRIGWIYQQLLKLYAPFVIPNISSNVLVLDADVIFLAPVVFQNEAGEPFFNVSDEYHAPYFAHIDRLLPGLKRVYPEYSGIAHYMLFQKPILEDLFLEITRTHRTQPWRALCYAIDSTTLFGSPLSEYELYFNFALTRTDQAHIRPQKFMDVYPLRALEKYRKLGYTYITSHERP